VFILKEVEVICFDTLLQVFILLGLQVNNMQVEIKKLAGSCERGTTVEPEVNGDGVRVKARIHAEG
jgi:hypothetical protein